MNRVVNKFIELVKIDSVSGKEERLAQTLKNELTDLGLEVVIDKEGNVIGTLRGNLNVPPLLFCAHMDTVQPGEGIEPIIEDGYIKSKGDTILGADDKAGIVAIIEALRHITENHVKHGNIEVFLTVEEEIGLNGSMRLDHNLLNAKIGYVLDSDGPVGTIVNQGPYHNKVKIYVKGRAAHAGVAPEEGINAIQASSKALARIKLGRIDDKTTTNIGIISGGKAINIIPDSVYLEGEARSLEKELMDLEIDKMERIFREEASLLGATIEFNVEVMYPGMHIAPDSQVIRLAQQAIKNMKLIPKIASTGGGSDATILNDKGISTVNLGLGYYKPHSTEETIEIESLVRAVDLVVNIVKEASKS